MCKIRPPAVQPACQNSLLWVKTYNGAFKESRILKKEKAIFVWIEDRNKGGPAEITLSLRLLPSLPAALGFFPPGSGT